MEMLMAIQNVGVPLVDTRILKDTGNRKGLPLPDMHAITNY